MEPNPRARTTDASSVRAKPPWLVVLMRHLPAGQSLSETYRRLGLTDGQAYWLRRCGSDLRLSVASRMALAVGADLPKFLAEVATEQGIPPLGESPPLFRPPRPGSKKRRCTLCQEPGHDRRNCRSPRSFELLRLRGSSAVSPKPTPRKRKPNDDAPPEPV